MQATRPITKPTKQRKMMYNAPDHIRHKLLAAHLSAELRATHLIRSFPVRSGDTIRVVRGDHKGFEGKISRIDIKKFRIYLEGLTREKVDGTTIFVAVHPSKILITRLNLDDKWRKRILERKQRTQTKPKESRKKAKRVTVQKISESIELKEPVEEVLEKPSEEEKQAPPETESKAPATEEPAEEQKAEAVEPPKKKAVERRKRATKTTTKKKAKTEPEKEKKPEPEQKRPRRKSNKKADEGDV